MNLLVPIYRFNWYRTLAPVVDEALARGHRVTCLHNVSGDNFASNRPSEDRFPKFRNGRPVIRGYDGDAALDREVLADGHDAIVSIDMPLRRWIDGPDWEHRRARYVALATPDTLKRLHDRPALDAVDLFLVRSEREREAAVLDRTTDYRELAREARSLGADGRRFLSFVEPRIGNEWDARMVADFRAKTKVCGYPLLDGLSLVDREEIVRRWKLRPEGPRIGLWATPVAGRGAHADWDRLFSETDRLRFRAKALRIRGLAGLREPFLNEEHCLDAIRSFADRNGAEMLVKLRHYQNPEGNLFADAADRVVGEDSFYPHSALEMASVCDLMIGFTTSGSPEAVWAGSPVLDIEPPGSGRDLLKRSLHFWDGMLDAPGVVRSLTAERLVRELPGMDLADFRFEAEALRRYREDYCGPATAPTERETRTFSAAALDAVEEIC